MAKYKKGDSRSQSTPEQKAYWMKQIIRKANTAYSQFDRDIKSVADMAHHSGMDDKELSNLALMMADRFTAVIRRLAPKVKDVQTATEKATKGKAKTATEVKNKKD